MAKTKKSALAGLGDAGRDAVAATKDNETKGAGDFKPLPAGIRGGIAQVSDCGFDSFERSGVDVPYFFARATIKEPQEFANEVLEGRQTSIMMTLEETDFNTFQESVDAVLNEMRKLGVDTSKIDLNDFENELEGLASAIKVAMPYTKFGTKRGKKKTEKYPDGRVYENWNGHCAYESTNGESEGDSTEGFSKPQEDAQEPSGDESDIDYLALGKAADKGDRVREKQLISACESFDVDYEKIDSWLEVAELVVAKITNGDAKAIDVPEKDGIYLYSPPGKGGRKKKAIPCEVLFNNIGECQSNLKNVKTNDIYSDVPWDELSDVE